jgi:hypothetical protein
MSLILSGTDGLSDVDGSAATPAIRGTDANTGIFFPAADTIAFSEGGVEAARIDSSGNFGLGVTPSAWGGTSKALQLPAGSLESRGQTISMPQNAYYNGTNWIYSSTTLASLYAQNGGIHYFYNAASGTAGNTVSFTQAMTLDASGNLGVGETSPTAKLHIGVASAAVNGTKGVRITNPAGTVVMLECGNGGDSFVGTTSGSDFNIRTGNVTRATFDNSGNLLVGTTNNSNLASAQGLYLRGTGADNCLYGLNNATTTSGVSLALFYSSFSTANQTKFEVKSNGDVSSRTNSYGGFSDVRLKQGITPASSQWSDIKNIEVVKFQMKSEQFSDAENPWMLGVIAQQVEQVSPRLVDEDVKDGMKTVKYSILYMKAVKALQEAMARIEQLEVDVAALKGTA